MQADTAERRRGRTGRSVECESVHDVGLNGLEGEDHGSANEGHALSITEVRDSS